MHFQQPLRVAIGTVTLLALLAPTAASSDEVDEKTLYYLGVALGRNLTNFQLSAKELDVVLRAAEDAVQGKAENLDDQIYGAKLRDFAQARQEVAAAQERDASASFLARAGTLEGAQKTDSGLIITHTQTGNGASPGPTDTVKVHYHGSLRDGTVFDSSVERGTPAEFPLNRVIPCWTEALQRMKVGGKSKLVCPSGIAYGDRGMPPKIPGGAALTFEVELIEIVKK